MKQSESEITTYINFEASEEKDCKLVVVFSLDGHNIMRSDTDITYDQAGNFIKDLENELKSLQSNKQVNNTKE